MANISHGPSSILDAVTEAQPLQTRLFRSGGWHDAASGATFTTSEPATGATLATVADGGPEDLEVAVRAAAEAQRAWKATPVAERASALRALADRVEAEADRLGTLDARDTGSPFREMRTDALRGAASLRYMAGLGFEMKGDTIPVRPGDLHYTSLEPWGVVARVIAFNHPGLFACGRLGPALMAGNAVILKAPDLAPLAVLALAELSEGLLPDGVLSVLSGGPALGAAIARHPELRRMSFTGGLATAQKVAEGAAASGVVKTVTYELGGKNPMIVYPDTDLDEVAEAVIRGMNFTRVQGQSCGSTSRLIVHGRVHDELVDRVVERASTIVLGDPTDPGTDMGPLIDHAARDRCLGFVERAVADGATLRYGGRAPDDPELGKGAYLLPTVLTDVDSQCELGQTEVFGPVLATQRFTEEHEAVALANDVRYGLTAAVWTGDLGLAMRTVDQLEVGYVWVNDVETRYPAVPFGGWKDSGTGLEHGIEELLSFTRTKAVNIKLPGQR